jgi:hypothetical protein
MKLAKILIEHVPFSNFVILAVAQVIGRIQTGIQPLSS